jgi:hypothetical protein
MEVQGKLISASQAYLVLSSMLDDVNSGQILLSQRRQHALSLKVNELRSFDVFYCRNSATERMEMWWSYVRVGGKGSW